MRMYDFCFDLDSKDDTIFQFLAGQKLVKAAYTFCHEIYPPFKYYQSIFWLFET